MYRQERHHLDTFLTHTFKETPTYIPATHIVVDQFHFHPLTRFIDQGIGHQTAQCIFGKDIHINMDMTLGLHHVTQ